MNFSGKLYKTCFYGVEKETGRIDYDKVAEIALRRERPKDDRGWASAYSRDMDFKRFREIADSVGAFLFADISHPAGLIAKGLLSTRSRTATWCPPPRTRRFADRVEE